MRFNERDDKHRPGGRRGVGRGRERGAIRVWVCREYKCDVTIKTTFTFKESDKYNYYVPTQAMASSPGFAPSLGVVDSILAAVCDGVCD